MQAIRVTETRETFHVFSGARDLVGNLRKALRTRLMRFANFFFFPLVLNNETRSRFTAVNTRNTVDVHFRFQKTDARIILNGF